MIHLFVNGFLILKCISKKDKVWVTRKGTWFIMKVGLFMKPWWLDFSFPDIKCFDLGKID